MPACPAISGIPSHDGPSSSQMIFDNSHNETSYGNYTNMGQHGVINNHYQAPRSNPLDELRKRCSPSAAFNSAARFDPPRCAESTRLQIMQRIEEWMNSDKDNAGIFWLYGGAGAGKSAVAQSLSEKLQTKELAASFFFFRGDSTRNSGDGLIPTLVSQLVRNIKGLVPFVENRIDEDWDIFTKGYDIQFRELVVEPLLSLKSTDALDFPPRFVVIDGLDECTNPDVQCLLLRAIARALPHIPYPLRFLITSRPEAHITHVFNHDPALQAIPVQRYNLSDDPDADMDIRNFLEKEFMDIRKVHRLGNHLPHTWPDHKVIGSLVERSSGHFIYASTVIRYIQSPKHRPDDRLEVILRLRPSQEGDQPYAQLDALYGLIFAGVESRVQLERICLVLGVLYFQSKQAGFFSTAHGCTTIEKVLGMKVGDLVLLLDPILSLVTIEGDKIRIFHKTLFDYLLDFDRGGHLPFDLSRVHETAAAYILTDKIANVTCDMSNLDYFAFHCQYGYLNDALKDFLFSLEVPCPKFLKTFEVLPPWDDERNLALRRSMWHFIRTMSREDFDSTGRVYEKYLKNWITHLERPLQVSKVGVMKVWLKHRLGKTSECKARMVDAKRKLDKLLIEWKPKNFNTRDAKGIDLASKQLNHIKREYRIFSAFVAASLPENANELASSLICGDAFIHTYTFTLRNREWPMVAHSYSMLWNASFRSSWDGASDTVAAMMNHLDYIENCLATGHYIKYGLDDAALG